MGDRTMLELAAKAAGIEWIPANTEKGIELEPVFGLWLKIHGEPYEEQRRRWNPLANDGDALRLASELHINIEFVKGLTTKQFIEISAYPSGRGDCLCLEPIGDDPNQAARRAVTRAAAAIQLAKESGK